jgi:phage terminase small subunit
MDRGGRPHKPKHLKVLAGDRKDRINEAEPVPSPGEVAPPWPLTKAAQEVWDRLAPDLIDKQLLTPWDIDAFAFFCESLAIAKGKMSSARRRPAPGAASPMSEFKQAMSVVATLGGRFGWTPSDRQKLVAGEASIGSGKEDLLTG